MYFKLKKMVNKMVWNKIAVKQNTMISNINIIIKENKLKID